MVSKFGIVRLLAVLFLIQVACAGPCSRRRIREERLIRLLSGASQPKSESEVLPLSKGEGTVHVRPARELVYQPYQQYQHQQPHQYQQQPHQYGQQPHQYGQQPHQCNLQPHQYQQYSHQCPQQPACKPVGCSQACY